MMRRIAVAAALMMTIAQGAWALDNELVTQTEAALSKCVTYLTDEVAYHGGYGGSYLADLSDQWGEGHILRHMNWVQPPGSPSTGQAFLAAWAATGDQQYLDAAKQCADALVWGQLGCGGWTYNTDFSRAGEEHYFYRHNRDSDDPKLKAGRNIGTFDDNTSEAAIRLLMAVDEAFEGKDEPIHEAAIAGLEWVLKSQYDYGGFPQWYPLFSRGYHNWATYNDNNMYNIMYLLMAAEEQYQDPRMHDALMKLGEFFISSQMPEPQAVWCQQYDSEGRPAWARRFEPPCITGGESRGVMSCLIQMALYTGDTKYLKPIPAALDWYRRSQLPGGKWARFYEFKTNRPLYFTSDNRTTYRLTYDDSDAPDHYGFKGQSFPTSQERAYNEIMAKGIEQFKADHKPRELTTQEKLAKAESMEQSVRDLLAAQTDKGVWLTKNTVHVYGPMGAKIILMSKVQRNIRRLSDYLGYVNDR